MASLSATTSQSCQGTQGLLTLDSMSDAPGAPSGGSYSWTIIDQATGTDYGGPVSAGDAVAVPDATYTVRVYASYPNGSSASSSPRTYTVACAGSSGGGGGGGGGTTPPAPVPGCTDPDADNYSGAATSDDGSCTYSPRLVAAALPELAPLGVPLTITLAAAAVAGATPAPASCLLDLAGLGTAAGVMLLVDGYRFTSGPLIVPGRFTDAATLLAALQSQPGLAPRYVFTLESATQVRVTGRTPGLPGTPTASTSDAARVALTPTAGVAALWSQRRYQWGCYAEVWAGCGSVFGGPVSKGTAQLAGRFVLPYRADNTYSFDVASLLRQFTGHAAPVLGVCADRLVSYFVRFGEEYADAASGLRQVRTVYESAVAWGLEAMEVPAEVAPGLRLLTARPQPWRVQPGDRLPCGLLATPLTTRRLLLRTRPATSRATTDLLLATPTATGQVLVPGYLLPAADHLSGELRDGDTGNQVGQPALLAALDFTAQGQALTFVNRQGSQDTVYFLGTSDPGSKRTAATFSSAAGPQALTAEVALPTKLTSGLLSYAEWDWLRRELSVSPAVWVEGALVLVNDVAAEADPVKQEYTITVDYSPAPMRGLSN